MRSLKAPYIRFPLQGSNCASVEWLIRAKTEMEIMGYGLIVVTLVAMAAAHAHSSIFVSSVQSLLNPKKRVSFHFVITLVAY